MYLEMFFLKFICSFSLAPFASLQPSGSYRAVIVDKNISGASFKPDPTNAESAFIGTSTLVLTVNRVGTRIAVPMHTL
jgi:hypothetical protein